MPTDEKCRRDEIAVSEALEVVRRVVGIRAKRSEVVQGVISIPRALGAQNATDVPTRSRSP